MPLQEPAALGPPPAENVLAEVGNVERVWLEAVGVSTCAAAERGAYGFGSGVAAIVRKQLK